MEADEDFDIYTIKDNRNLKAKGINGKNNSAKEVARRAKQTEKRSNQGSGMKESPVVE